MHPSQKKLLDVPAPIKVPEHDEMSKHMQGDEHSKVLVDDSTAINHSRAVDTVNNSKLEY